MCCHQLSGTGQVAGEREVAGPGCKLLVAVAAAVAVGLGTGRSLKLGAAVMS